jgi:hypothetical protein
VTESASSEVAVTLSLAPTLEERIIDWLLGRDDIETFTGYTTYSHGAASGELSLAGLQEELAGHWQRAAATS